MTAVDPLQALLSHFNGQADVLVDHMTSTFVESIAAYRNLSAAQLTDVGAITRHNIELCLRTVREQRAPTEAELEPFESSARRRARQGWPLEALLRAYRLGMSVAWEVSRGDLARSASSLEATLDLATGLLRYLDAVQSVVARGYLDEQRHLSATEDRRHADLIGVLATAGAGSPAANVAAERAGVRLADAYAVVLVAVPEARTLHRLARAARGLRRAEVVAAPWNDELLLVLWPGAVVPATRRAIVELMAPRQVTAAVVDPRPGDLQSAIDEASLVADLVRDDGPGWFRLRDVALSALIARADPRLAEVLERRIEPILATRHGDRELVETLDVYIRTHGSSAGTAAVLSVHRNTVAYRLDRIRDLTGLDPRRTVELFELFAALRLHQIAGRA